LNNRKYCHEIIMWKCDKSNKAATLVFYCVCAAYCPSYNKFRCRMGLCLRSSVYCNGTAECPDGSDEPPNCQSELLC